MDSNDKETNILLVVGTLFDAAADRDEVVREAVITSLRQLAKKYPSKVLKHAVEYRRSNPKMSATHLAALLRTMELVCQERLADVDGDEVLQLIEFSLAEMTRTSEYLPSLQLPAAGILTALGKAHCNEVMEGLLKHFQPGVVPHYTILHTMGSLASANTFGIIPFIKATLGTMLPMMGMLRTDAMRQVFAYTLGKFSEAVSEYMANIDHAPDPTVKAEAFSTELSIAYDVLASAWINSKEQKVVEMVLQALGSMVDVLPPDKVVEQVPRLVSTLLALYRRNINPHPVTQCLAAVLLVAMTHCKTGLEPQLDHLLGVMFDLVCTYPDYAQPLTVKNHYEVLRCFDRIACHFTDRVVELLIQQLKNNNEHERIKALFVITHLINSSENLIKSRIMDLIMGLRNMLGEHNVKVKKVLLKTIVAFAYRGYMEGSEGRDFVEFIIKHCCPVVTSGSREEDAAAHWEELRVACNNTLYLLATTVPQVEASLWPVLLHFMLAPQYTAASPVLARCLAHLATKRQDDLNCNSLTKDDVPTPNTVFGRCLALLGSPLESSRGIFILTFLKNYAFNVNRHLRPLWEQKIPELILHLEDYKDAWQDQVWEDLVLDFVSATLNEVDEEKWTLSVGLQLMDQLGSYASHLPERAILYKCMAVAACHTMDKQYIQQQLDVLLNCARHHCPVEACAAARAVGICARAHLHDVLARLRRLSQEELNRKSSRLLPFMKDSKHEGEQERVRHTLLLCYGEVAVEAPGVELLPQLEHGPAHWVLQQLHTVKDAEGKELALRALGSIVEAFHPNRNSLHVVLHGRSQVLQLVLGHLSLGPRTYPTALQVLTALVKLPPPPSPEERVEVLKTCFTHVFLAVKAADVQPQGGQLNDITAGLQWSEEAALILYALGTLVQELLLLSVTPATLDDVFTLLEPWLSASGPHERAAATATLCTVLQCYLDNLKFGYEAPSRFGQTGQMLGCIVPRCTDPSLAVRQKAIDCVRLVLCLAARYEGQHTDHDNDLTSALCTVQDQVMTDDPNKLFRATGELAQIMCGKVPHWQLMNFTVGLLDAVLDPAPSSACGASVVLNALLKSKGGELYPHVTDLLASLLGKLGSMHCEQVRTGCLRAVLSLAAHHPKAVVTALLYQPIPYQPSVVECWQVLAQDADLSSDIVEQFVRLLSTSPLYEELPEKERFKMAVLQPLAAISAMKEMFRVARMQELAIDRFPELFCLLYLAMCCYVGTSPPIHTPQHNKDRLSFVPNRSAYKLSPARVAQDAFQSFLLCARCETVAEALLQCSTIETKESLNCFVAMVPYLVRALCLCVPHTLPKLITHLNQYATSSYDPHRIAVAAFYSELIVLQVNGQMVLLESVVSSQLNCLTDPSPMVRQLCLTGLAFISKLDVEQRGRYTESVLAALTQGLDDPDTSGNIALAAVRGFSQMLSVIDDNHIQAIQGTVAIRIKHFFEREDPSIRAAAIRMFGDLAKSSRAGSKSAFREQVTGNLVCFLLHLSDGDEHVVKACKYTLRQVGPLLQASHTNAMLQDHLVDEATLHFPDFMADLSKLMAQELPELVPHMIMNALSYIKSSWPAIRGNAGILIGVLHGALPADVASTVQLDVVCSRLSLLLRDDDATVRTKGAKAIGIMFPG